MICGRGAGDQQNVGRTLKKPGKRDLHRSGFEGCGYLVELRRLQWGESTQGEERNVSDALPCESIDESIVSALCHVVEVLDANDLSDFLSFLELPGSDVAQTDVANQSLALQIGERHKRLLDRSFQWLRNSTYAQVDDVEAIDTKIPKVVMRAVDQLLA